MAKAWTTTKGSDGEDLLHADDHAIGTYEFPKVAGADLPVKDGEQVVMKKITLTVS